MVNPIFPLLSRDNRERSRLYILLLVLVGLNFQGNAQIIKVDKDWVQTDSANLWQGVADITADNVKNTISIFQMAGAVQVSHSWEKAVALSASSLRLLYEENEPLENAGFQHFRYIQTLDSKLSLEAFSQIQFDQLLKIKMRWITGTGIRFTLLDTEKSKLYLRPGYMYEYEKEDSTRQINRHHRMSNYVTLRLKGDKNVKFYFTIFYQPRLNNFADYRLSPAWTIELSVLKKLTFTFSGDFRYDTKPVEGVDRTAYVLTNGIGWRF